MVSCIVQFICRHLLQAVAAAEPASKWMAASQACAAGASTMPPELASAAVPVVAPPEVELPEFVPDEEPDPELAPVEELREPPPSSVAGGTPDVSGAELHAAATAAAVKRTPTHKNGRDPRRSRPPLTLDWDDTRLLAG